MFSDSTKVQARFNVLPKRAFSFEASVINLLQSTLSGQKCFNSQVQNARQMCMRGRLAVFGIKLHCVKGHSNVNIVNLAVRRGGLLIALIDKIVELF